MKRFLHILSVCLLSATGLSAQSAPGSAPGSAPSIRLVPRLLEVRDDSLRIHLDIHACGITLASDESLTLLPELQRGKKRVVLPSVVLAGTKRARFDQRAAALRPELHAAPYHVWSGVRRSKTYLLNYVVSLPYAPWMQHASLRLRQVAKDCCTERLLAYDQLTPNINVPSPWLPNPAPPSLANVASSADVSSLSDVPSPSDVPSSKSRLRLPSREGAGGVSSSTATLSYPFLTSSAVSPSYGTNRAELQKIDRLLAPLLENPRVRFREIRVTCYMPSDAGGDVATLALAEARALGLRNYLSRAYALQGYPFRTAWQIVDGNEQEQIEVHLIYTEQ